MSESIRHYADIVYETKIENRGRVNGSLHVCNYLCADNTHVDVVYEFINFATEEQVTACLNYIEIISCKRIFEYTPQLSVENDIAIGAYRITFKWRK